MGHASNLAPVSPVQVVSCGFFEACPVGRCGGCTVGVYETYSGKVVNVIDASGADCREPVHRQGARLSTADLDAFEHEPAGASPNRPPR